MCHHSEDDRTSHAGLQLYSGHNEHVDVVLARTVYGFTYKVQLDGQPARATTTSEIYNHKTLKHPIFDLVMFWVFFYQIFQFKLLFVSILSQLTMAGYRREITRSPNLPYFEFSAVLS